MTDKRLIFKAHALNIGQKEYVVLLQNIKFAQNTFHILVPTPNMIKIELQSGEIYKFVVKGKEKDTWKNLILEYAKKARSNVQAESTETTNIQFCSNCGGKISVGARFCAKCGNGSGQGDFDGEINNKYVWALATVPILTSWMIVWLFGIFGLTFSTIVTIVLNIVFLSLDVKVLENAGKKPEKWLWLGVVLIPLYLFVRANMTDKKYGYGIVWCILFLIGIIF